MQSLLQCKVPLPLYNIVFFSNQMSLWLFCPCISARTVYIKYLMIQTSMWNPHFIDTRNLGEITKRVQEAMEEKNLNQGQLFFCPEKGLFLENPNSGWNCYFFFTKGFRSADFVCSVTLCFLPKVKKLNISDINRAINHPIIMFIESSFGIYLREGMSPKLSSLHQNIVAI